MIVAHHFVAMQIIFASTALLFFALWLCCSWLPLPGIAVAIIGVAAATMSIHEGMSPWHRALWMLIIGAFLVIEILAIKHAEVDQSNMQQNALREEREHFGEIGKGIEAAISKSDKQFKATMQQFVGVATALKLARTDIAKQSEFLTHEELHVMSVIDLAKRAQQIASDLKDLPYLYNYEINQEAGLSYWDHVDGGQSSPAELAQLKTQMENKREEYRAQHKKQAAKIIILVKPICEEMVSRLDSSDRTTEDKQWASELASPPADASDDMGKLGLYMEKLSARVIQKARTVIPN